MPVLVPGVGATVPSGHDSTDAADAWKAAIGNNGELLFPRNGSLRDSSAMAGSSDRMEPAASRRQPGPEGAETPLGNKRGDSSAFDARRRQETPEEEQERIQLEATHGSGPPVFPMTVAPRAPLLRNDTKLDFVRLHASRLVLGSPFAVDSEFLDTNTMRDALESSAVEHELSAA